MDDQQVLSRIDQLVQEEERLLHRHEGESSLSPAEHARLEQLKVQLDQAWDYLRQRRALRQYGEDPDEASERGSGTVENYEG
jgi:hypothetical protein